MLLIIETGKRLLRIFLINSVRPTEIASNNNEDYVGMIY